MKNRDGEEKRGRAKEEPLGTNKSDSNYNPSRGADALPGRQQAPLLLMPFLLLPPALSTIKTDSWRADRMLMFEKMWV